MKATRDSIPFTENTNLYNIPDLGQILVYQKDGISSVGFIDPILTPILVGAGTDLLVSLGSKAIGKLFGTSDSPNLDALLKKLIVDVANIIRETVDASDIRRATSQINSSIILLAEYSKSPSTFPERLKEAYFKSNDAVEELKMLLPASSAAYVLGVYTRISAIQQVALNTRSKEEVKNLQLYAEQSLPTLISAIDSLVSRTLARVGAVSLNVEIEYGEDPNHVRPPGLPTPKWKVYVCSYIYDGSVRSFRSKIESEAWSLANAQNAIDRGNVEAQFQLQFGSLLSKAQDIISKLSKWTLPKK
jgi:hypothetical protein